MILRTNDTLSFWDTGHLMRLLNDIVDAGNSMIIIEHDTGVLKNCDYLIELGPGGGVAGGRIIAAGTITLVHSLLRLEYFFLTKYNGA